MKKISTKAFEGLMNEWIPLVQLSCPNKEIGSMLLLLVKQFIKQKIDYETLSNSVEELLLIMPNLLDDLMKRLASICSSIESKPAQMDTLIIISDPIPSPKMRKRRAIANDIKLESPDTEYVDIDTKYISTSQAGSGSTMEDSAEIINYILNSICDHLESQKDIYNNKKPIPEFKRILDTSTGVGYKSVDDLDADFRKMVKKMEKKGSPCVRVKKFYEYLIGYYFPSFGKKGKLRSGRLKKAAGV